MNGRKQGLITVCLLTALVWGVNLSWLRRDARLPVWDMAMHQSYALNYLSGYPTIPRVVHFWERSGNYPPLVHLMIALMFLTFHPGPHIAALVNIPATLLLFWGIYALGLELAGIRAARWACILTALIPYLIWMSRETILDYWLSAWVVAGLVLLYRSRGFENRPVSLLLGCVMALGMLTKWLFAGLVVFPLIYICVKYRLWRHPARALNCLDALLIAAVGAGIWYLPNLPKLVRYFSDNSHIGVLEGEPPVFSFQSLIYYPRLLEGYQLFAILFVLFCLACIFVFRRRTINDAGFIAAALLGGWFFLTMLQTKDPRFSMPLLGLATLIMGSWIQSWPAHRMMHFAKGALVTMLAVQAYAANFGISWLPQRMVLAQGYQGSLRWDWNVYLQDYFGILGPPRREDWKHADILSKVSEHAKQFTSVPSLALIPELPFFSAANFNLYARMRGIMLRVDHLSRADGGLHAFDGFDYVIMSEGQQGMSWTTHSAKALNKIIVDEHRIFRLLGLYPLPNGDYARLYFIQRGERPLG